MDVKFFQVKPELWYTALGVVKTFLRDYPNRKVGFHAGVIYFGNEHTFYVYKTKTQIVVRGQ